MYHVNVNVNSMEENAIQIKSGITTNFDVSVRNTIYVKKIIFWVLLHLVVKMVNLTSVIDDSVVMCDEI